MNQPETERFLLSALNVAWYRGPVELIASFSYFKRETTEYYNAFAIEDLSQAGYLVPGAGDLSDANYINKQHNITAEARLQPADPTGVFNWTVGSFFQHARAVGAGGVYSNFIGELPRYQGAVDGGPPFGVGSSGYVDWFGETPLAGTQTWYGHFLGVDRQFALYGQMDYRIAPAWQATLGGAPGPGTGMRSRPTTAAPRTISTHRKGVRAHRLPLFSRTGRLCGPVSVGHLNRR